MPDSFELFIECEGCWERRSCCDFCPQTVQTVLFRPSHPSPHPAAPLSEGRCFLISPLPFPSGTGVYSSLPSTVITMQVAESERAREQKTPPLISLCCYSHCWLQLWSRSPPLISSFPHDDIAALVALIARVVAATPDSFSECALSTLVRAIDGAEDTVMLLQNDLLAPCIIMPPLNSVQWLTSSSSYRP